MNDGENVVITNALGVIILELGNKWCFYLGNAKREIIIDILINLLNVNPQLIFFKSFFNLILLELIRILSECFGKKAGERV